MGLDETRPLLMCRQLHASLNRATLPHLHGGGAAKSFAHVEIGCSPGSSAATGPLSPPATGTDAECVELGSVRTHETCATGHLQSSQQLPPEDDIEDLHQAWAAREVPAWEQVNECTVRFPDGQALKLVVNDMAQLVASVGRENCY